MSSVPAGGGVAVGTLNPGRSGQSTAHCAGIGIGTGIGEISVRP
ncbi:hypothetical protein [Streptomyces atratus]